MTQQIDEGDTRIVLFREAPDASVRETARARHENPNLLAVEASLLHSFRRARMSEWRQLELWLAPLVDGVPQEAAAVPVLDVPLEKAWQILLPTQSEFTQILANHHNIRTALIPDLWNIVLAFVSICP